jgi:hypothetical protein
MAIFKEPAKELSACPHLRADAGARQGIRQDPRDLQGVRARPGVLRRLKWAAAENYFSFLKERFRDAPSEVFLRQIALFKLDPPARTGTGSST